MPRDWLLDLGHSRLKLARRERTGGLARVETLPARRFAGWLERGPSAAGDRFWLAAVPNDAAVRPVVEALEESGFDWCRIETGSRPMPVAPAYAGLGVDRWLAMQAAWEAVGAAFCVVDVGTATTIDIVDDDAAHRGGWILPGPETARAGLLQRAHVLEHPRIDAGTSLAPARDTALALERGIRLQQIGAVERALGEAEALLGRSRVALVLSGGAGATLQSHFDEARVEPDLALRGLAMAVEPAGEQ